MILTHRGPAGIVFLTDIDALSASCSWGIYIGSDSMRGKGLGVEATYLSLEQAFRYESIEQVNCEVLENNRPAINLYSSMGFTRASQGSLSHRKDGTIQSVISMRLTRSEWDLRVAEIRNRLGGIVKMDPETGDA